MGRTHAIARYRELGAELRKRRQAAGLTGAKLAERTGWSPTKISRIEHGQREIGLVDMMHYLGFCGVYRREALDLMAMCRDAEHKHGHWLSPYGQWLEDSLSSLIFHETTADRSTSYDPLVVPGLLQTADYARAWVAGERWRTSDDVEQCVRTRMERQRILQVPHPAPMKFFVHEQALLLPVGNLAVMREQLLKLTRLAALGHITVRVVPMSAVKRWAFGGPFRLFEYAQHKPLVYLPTYSTGLFLEDQELVQPYRTLLPGLAEVALDARQSLEWIASLASQFDQGSQWDAGQRLEEEQL